MGENGVKRGGYSVFGMFGVFCVCRTFGARVMLEILERVKGIEPSSLAWKAMALPLSYTRACCRPTLAPGSLARTFGTASRGHDIRALPAGTNTDLGEDGIAGSRGGFDRRLRDARRGRLRCMN